MPVAVRLVPWLWGALAAWGLTRFYFRYAPGQMHQNHEGYSYVYRAIEFMDLLAAGYWSPQWATHFRGGLGSPYFGYYQSGFFYVVAAFGTVLPIMTALAVAVWAFALLGYGGTFALVRGQFGTPAGILAGTGFLAASYVQSELYVRGDLSELAGMAMLAATLAALVGWLEDGGRWRWAAVAAGGAAVVVTHPVAGLVGYATFAGTIVVWAASARALRRPLGAALALVVGTGLAAFYWLPLWLEWGLVSGDRAASGTFHFSANFVAPLAFLGLAEQPWHLSVTLHVAVLSLAGLATVALAWRWRNLTPPQRRLAVVLWSLVLGSTVFATEVSSPAWNALPLVGLIQFPWRLVMVQTIALSALGACFAGAPRVAMALATAAVAWPLVAMVPPGVKAFEHAETAADLEQLMVAPDGADEWLPAGARRVEPPLQWREPTLTRGVVEEFERRAGHLRVRIRSDGVGVLTLPHYWFPVGWSATLYGRPAALRPSPDGLMTTFVAGNAVLEARFRTTPARRTGLVVSGTTLALLVTAVALWRRRPE